MAEIKMDISEYEVMKENKKLLEDALEREKQLSNEIKKLHEEKIQAFEDAQHKVVNITNHIHKKCVYGIKDEEYVIQRILSYVRYNNYNLDRQELKNLIISNLKYTEENISETKTVELKCIDAFKQELKKELKDELDDETKYKLKEYESLITEYNKEIENSKNLLNKNNVLSDLLETANQRNTNLCKEIIELKKEIESKDKEINKSYKQTEAISKIKTRLQYGYGFWGRGKIIKDILSYIREL